jgi:hypothetical protein
MFHYIVNMDLKDIHKKIQYNSVRIAQATLAVFMISMMAILLSPYHTSLVAAQITKQVANTNNTNSNISSALPTITAVQKNATAESIAKATGTNSTGITGFNSSSPMKGMINPVFKMTRNPLANMTNPLNSSSSK